MTVPGVTYGRSAWTTKGKDNGTSRYALVDNMPKDGISPERDINYQAVHLAVRAIQLRLNDYLPNMAKLIGDGVFGIETDKRVRAVQQQFGLLVDGRVGSITSRYLWRPLITKYATNYGFNPKYLYGMVSHESTLDCGAVGYFTPGDRGLVQVNLPSHPEISVGEAFDPNFALDYAAHRFSDALDKYKSKPALQIQCAILQHNSPLNASRLFNTGVYPSTTAKAYVDAVLSDAASY
jgi:hypothetical protein